MEMGLIIKFWAHLLYPDFVHGPRWIYLEIEISDMGLKAFEGKSLKRGILLYSCIRTSSLEFLVMFLLLSMSILLTFMFPFGSTLELFTYTFNIVLRISGVPDICYSYVSLLYHHCFFDN